MGVGGTLNANFRCSFSGRGGGELAALREAQGERAGPPRGGGEGQKVGGARLRGVTTAGSCSCPSTKRALHEIRGVSCRRKTLATGVVVSLPGSCSCPSRARF